MQVNGHRASGARFVSVITECCPVIHTFIPHLSSMKALWHRCLPLITLAVLLAACDDPSGPVGTGHVVSVQIDSSIGPITRVITVQLDKASRVEVTYAAQGTKVLTVSADSVAMKHRLVLPRLRAERSYMVEVAVPGDDASALRTTFETRPLPPLLAEIDLRATGTPTLPVGLVEVAQAERFFGALLIVEDAEIVGYVEMAGPLFGSTRRANGEIVLLDNALGLVSRRLDGSVAHRLPQPDSAPGAAYGRIHHDVTATPGNTLLFIANEVRPVGGTPITGEALWEWNPEAGTVVKRWSAFDHLTWQGPQGRSTVGNWLHGNGIKYGPRGNVLMSLRNINQVISIAPDFSRLEWKLGGAGSLAIADADRFFGQHYVSEPTLNRVLIYDNGFQRPSGPFTRAIEYRIDVAAGTATPVWQYRPSPDVLAALVGSVQRHSNGNTTVLFGMRNPDDGSFGPLDMTVVEVNGAGNVVWQLAFDKAVLKRIYRWTPVASLLGERPGAFRE